MQCEMRVYTCGVILALLVSGLVSCSSVMRENEQTEPLDSESAPRISTAESSGPTAIAPKCYGLFAHLETRPHREAESQVLERAGIFYGYDVGQPITATVAVVVFGEGRIFLPIVHRGLGAWHIIITDPQGEEREVYHLAEGSVSNGWASQNAPYVRTFALDDYFDLSDPGWYTLTVTRSVYLPSDYEIAHEIASNPVRFVVMEEGSVTEQP